MTAVAEALREATARLSETSDTARLDAELLMAHALGVTRSAMLLHHSRAAVPAAFAALVERRAGHEPVAYILGEQEFYGRTFEVTPDVLIPRADSEAVVAAALEAVPRPARVLDLGTGSGALLLTILAECPGAGGFGIDRSPAAVAVARANAAALVPEGAAQIMRRDWTVEGWADDLGTFDLLVANPPYVETDAPLDPSVRDHEPGGALFAGPEGLDDYRLLVPRLRALLRPHGVAVLEIGAAQAGAVGDLARASGAAVEVARDLAHRDRALILRWGLGKAG